MNLKEKEIKIAGDDGLYYIYKINKEINLMMINII
jgi:hypothetical protein